ncbi:helix-turn-helix domain-containing protein [Micromonospora radicis]|uniref:helix-turn-helix domain-containing protein n=1 Tax=Micromonospora radicis TaxID=1894971 RepID=UPI00131405C6|nr:GAF domain-containing protein [Micromonospora radicis]
MLLFAQGRDLVELADDAVQLVARETGAAAVFVYLWDEDEERLVLRVATPGPQQTGVGEIRLRLGEGITGWAALRRRSVIIDRDLQEDPRFIGFDEIEEEEFRSILAVPIADEQSRLRGVFALYSKDEAAFGEDELAIAVEVGRLLATGLLRAETVADLNRQSAAAHFLLDFPSVARTALVPCLQFAARRLLDLLDIDVCMLEYISRRESGATPIIFAFRSVDGDNRVWSTHSRVAAQSSIDQNCAGLENSSVAIGMGASHGVLSCYRRARFRARDFERMSVLATQLGVLLEAVDLNSVGSSLATRLRLTQDDAEAARILSELNVEGPVCPVVVRVHSVRGDWETVSRSLKDTLASVAGARGIVLLHSTWGMVLVDAPGGRVSADFSVRLLKALQRLSDETGLRASVGMGSVSPTPAQIRQSINHARQALDWTEAYGRGLPVTLASYAEIRDVLPLVEVVSSMAPKIAETARALDPLVRYDVAQGSHLVRTLAVLASCGGSVNEAAVRLVIHRNTLRQRMQRIEQLLGLSLDATTDWPVLGLSTRVAAIRVDKVRAASRR